MASVLVPPTLLHTNQRRLALSEEEEEAKAMHAQADSSMTMWWKLEPRADVWISLGAFAVGICATLVVLV